MKLIQLLRLPNLIMLALTQALIYYCVILPTLLAHNIDTPLPTFIIWGIIIATTLITAGGYVINDYFDIKIDRINKPNRLIITNGIEKSTAMRIYQILTALGIIIGIAVSIYLANFTIAFIYIVTPGMLWFYSASYKRQLIIGNLMVALATALSILIPLIAQSTILMSEASEQISQTPILAHLYTIVCGFAIFAFTFTLIREIIKDLQDQPGDREMECHTIPIVWGETATKIITSTITLIAIAGVLYCAHFHLNFSMENNLSFKYLLFGVAIPSLCTIFLIWLKDCKSYSYASNMVKFTMLLGVLYSIIYNFILAQTYDITFLGLFNIA